MADKSRKPGSEPPPSVIQSLQERTGSLLGVHLPEAEGDPEALLRINEKVRELGGTAGRYQVFGELARGGMGVVYQGRDGDLGRDVAMKVLREEHVDNAAVIERFVEEAQIGGQLQHPGIVPVYELGLSEDQRPFFAMKLVKGATLAEMLSARESVDADRRRFLGIFEKICQTMAYAHSRRVVHRDLKPANVMVGTFGEVQIVDWGVAKVLTPGGERADGERAEQATEAGVEQAIETARSAPGSTADSVLGSAMGTPSYMPPEQALGRTDAIDRRSDVFGLGAILCEILTGKPPYPDAGGATVEQAARAQLTEAHERIRGSGEDPALIELCIACLSAERGERPESAGKVSKAITDHLASVEERARRAEVGAVAARVRASAARRLWGLIAGVAVIGTTLVSYLVLAGNARRDAAEAQVRQAMQRLVVAYGDARTVEHTSLPAWGDAMTRATELASIVRQPDVGNELRDEATELVAEVRAERERRNQVEVATARLGMLRYELTTARLPREEELGDEDEQSGRPLSLGPAGNYEAAFERFFEADVRKMTLEAACDALRGDFAVEYAAGLFDWAWNLHRDAEGKSQAERATVRTQVEHLVRIARRLDPDDPWRNRMRDLRLTGASRQQIEKLAAEARVQDLPVATMLLLADSLGLVRAWNEEVRVLEEAVAVHPRNVPLRLALASAYKRSDDDRSAAIHMRIAVVLEPDKHELRMQLAWSLLRAGEFVEAQRLFERLVEQRPKDRWARRGLVYALREQGDVGAAIESAREMTEKFADARARDQLARVLEEAGRLEEALGVRSATKAPSAKVGESSRSARRVVRLQSLVDSRQEALEILSGKRQPEGVEQWLSAARYAAAVRREVDAARAFLAIEKQHGELAAAPPLAAEIAIACLAAALTGAEATVTERRSWLEQGLARCQRVVSDVAGRVDDRERAADAQRALWVLDRGMRRYGPSSGAGRRYYDPVFQARWRKIRSESRSVYERLTARRDGR